MSERVTSASVADVLYRIAPMARMPWEESVRISSVTADDTRNLLLALLAERDALEAKLAEARVERATRQEVYDLGRSEARKGFAREAKEHMETLRGEERRAVGPMAFPFIAMYEWLSAVAEGKDA